MTITDAAVYRPRYAGGLAYLGYCRGLHVHAQAAVSKEAEAELVVERHGLGSNELAAKRCIPRRAMAIAEARGVLDDDLGVDDCPDRKVGVEAPAYPGDHHMVHLPTVGE